MEITYKNQDGIKKLTIEGQDFYREIGQLLIRESCTNQDVEVDTEVGKVCYKLTLRSGTIFITELSNSLPDSLIHSFQPKFLTCINPETNAYKFYKLEQCGNHVKASYGRMGTKKGELFGERSFNYNLSMFWIKYYEKIQKGYQDHSDVYLASETETTKSNNNPAKQITAEKEINTVSSQLFARLNQFAKKAIEEAEIYVPITGSILKQSEKLINQLREDETVEAFNKDLLELMAILQRPVKTGDGTGVRSLMASSKYDFKKIILREVDIYQAMEGHYYGTNTSNTTTSDFKKYGIEVYIANDKQKKQVMDHLSETLQKKVKEVYRVIPRQQQDRFNIYLKEHKIHKVKQLWHGSKNQNWMSIMVNSLQLNPDAIITGKMFGRGIYFAPSSMKSWNYTSYKGTSWAHGKSDTAFMGLYAVAYGKPKDVDQWSSSVDYKGLVQNDKCDCLHAHAEKGFLQNDEIVFYDEAAMVMNYMQMGRFCRFPPGDHGDHQNTEEIFQDGYRLPLSIVMEASQFLKSLREEAQHLICVRI